MIIKRRLQLCLLNFSLALATACGGETIVSKVDPNDQNVRKAEGVLFSLPETLVVTEVPLTKAKSTPGVYYKWTSFFYPELDTDEYVTEEKTTFKVGVPSFSTRGQTDKDNVYIAHIKSKRFETKTLLLEFNEDGIIARTEASSKDETIDIVTSTAKTVASIAAPLIRGGFRSEEAKTSDQTKVDCQKKVQAAKDAAAQAAKAALANAQHPASKVLKARAIAAKTLADEAVAAASTCYEEEFKKQLSPRALALYESLDSDYVKFLKENFGFDFLLFVASKEDADDAAGTTDIEFFLTLSPAQRKFIEGQPRSTKPCVQAPPATRCLAGSVKTELIKAKAVYGKIQELRHKRESILAEGTSAQVNTSTNLEYRLKELDAQIKSMEETYFFGTLSEASGSARFEFKPAGALITETLFKYSTAGNKPGICENSVPPDNPGVFKAIWPRKFVGDCRGANHLFQLGDYRNIDVLVARLKAAAAGASPPAGVPTPDHVSLFLLSQFSLNTTNRLAGSLDTPQSIDTFLTYLTADLNAVITSGIPLHSVASFANIKLSPDTIKLINSGGLTAAQIIELNRLLLEDAYKKEIHRQKSWAARTVTLAVDPPPPGLASTVNTAIANNKLIEAGKRGFPYRVAPSTLAKLLDGDIEKGRGEVRIAQFGPVRTLPAHLGGRRSSYKITYYDASGAIKIFDMSADALIQKQNITDLTDAATTLRDSEAAKLKRETELLNAKKDRMNAEKAFIQAEKELRAARGEASPSPSP